MNCVDFAENTLFASFGIILSFLMFNSQGSDSIILRMLYVCMYIIRYVRIINPRCCAVRFLTHLLSKDEANDGGYD